MPCRIETNPSIKIALIITVDRSLTRIGRKNVLVAGLEENDRSNERQKRVRWHCEDFFD